MITASGHKKVAAWVTASDSTALAEGVSATVFDSILEMEIANMYVGMVAGSCGF